MKATTINIEDIINEIEKITGYPVFGEDIGKDEIKENNHYFIYSNDRGLRKSTKPNQFVRDFHLLFITTGEFVELDDIKLILNLQKHRLIFDDLSVDTGKISNTDKDIKAYTFTFHENIFIKCGI